MKVHFISIGGSVMHQLAIALKRKGYHVTGTDDEIFDPGKTNLQNEGLLPAIQGWQPELITPDIDAVILGMHAKHDNPELIKASQLNLYMYSFPEYIYQESRDKLRVVVGGSHGKTTTTSMIMHVLKKDEKEFDYLAGASLEGFEQSVKITGAPLIICEGDEYPASTLQKKPKFHFLFPHIAVITGIAWDHINVFPSFEVYVDQFRIFIEKIEPGGLLVYNDTDPVLLELVTAQKRSDIRYQPYSIPLHHIAYGITTLTIDGSSMPIKIFGNHNLLNLSAAFFVCRELGVSTAVFLQAMHTFSGANKRLELIAANTHLAVYRDFAHAPSKVKAAVEAVKEQYPERSLVTILELHTFSSLNETFLAEYAGSLNKADKAMVFYSEHALELKRMPPLPASVVQNGFRKTGMCISHTKEELSVWLKKEISGDMNVLFMSSGNYDGLNIQAFADEVTKN